MQIDIQIIIYILGLATTAGMIVSRISALERKVEKHNNLIERMYKVEERSKSNTHRLDELEEELRNEH